MNEENNKGFLIENSPFHRLESKLRYALGRF